MIEELAAGLRPGTPDNAPVLGPGALDGLQWAAGHFRHGILLAPITAELRRRAAARARSRPARRAVRGRRFAEVAAPA